jgi:phosphatidylethanolamine-binding protein (PEBP) family uncharacterized protein
MRSKRITLVAIAALGILSASCKQPSVQVPGTEKQKVSPPPTTPVEMTSPAFAVGQSIPSTFTCDADDQSPPLAWSGVPGGAKTIAIICDDPDAPSGTWVHWVIYGIDATSKGLAPGIDKAGTLPDGARQGQNDFKRIG